MTYDADDEVTAFEIEGGASEILAPVIQTASADLLKAGEAALRALEGLPRADYALIADALRAAVAKAKG